LHSYAAKDPYIPTIVNPSTSKYPGASTAKKYTTYCPITDTVTLLHIQHYPSSLEVATITKSWHIAAGTWKFTTLQKSYQKLLYRRDKEQNPKIHTLV